MRPYAADNAAIIECGVTMRAVITNLNRAIITNLNRAVITNLNRAVEERPFKGRVIRFSNDRGLQALCALCASHSRSCAGHA
jgi:hypothetical protein